MALFEQFPYLNFHEMNNSWLLDTVKRLSEKWENIDPDELERVLKNYIDEQMAIIGELKHEHAYNAIDIYVDCVNGSNVNGDGSLAHPYYSIAKALEYMDKTSAGVTIRMMAGGSYVINKAVLAACNIEFIAMASGITLAWLDNQSTRTHQAVDTRLKVQGDGTTKFYLLGTGDGVIDGSVLEIDSCEVSGDTDVALKIVNGKAAISNCVLNIALQASGSLVSLNNWEIQDSQRVSSRPALEMLDGSVLVTNGDMALTNLVYLRTPTVLKIVNGTLFDNSRLYPSTLFMNVKDIDAENADLHFTDYALTNGTFCAYNSASAAWNNIMYNGKFYDVLPVEFDNHGYPVALTNGASYNTYYPTTGFNRIGIKASMTDSGVSATNFVEIVKSIQQNWHPTIGLCGNTLFRLNCQFNSSGALRVVSCTAYDLTAGTYTTSQNANVTFDLYGVE